MTPTQFKTGEAYFGPLGEFLKTPSGAAMTQMMLNTDAALDLPPELEKVLKGMDCMQMLAFNHACLIGWRSSVRFMQNLAVPLAKSVPVPAPFSDDPAVRDWDEQIEAERNRQRATSETPQL